jgi:hypothetical protein
MAFGKPVKKEMETIAGVFGKLKSSPPFVPG